MIALVFFACGAEGRVRGTLKACISDMDCKVGEVCIAAQLQCAAVDPDQNPPPTNGKELLTNLSPMVFVIPDGAGQLPLLSADLVVLREHTVHTEQGLSATTLRARVQDGRLLLWNLRLFSPGGAIWSNGQDAVYVMNIQLEGSDEIAGDLEVDDYPHSHMTATTKIVLRADIGTSVDALVPFELTFDAVKVESSFDLEGRTLVASLALEGTWDVPGASQLLTISRLLVKGSLSGAQVPESW